MKNTTLVNPTCFDFGEAGLYGLILPCGTYKESFLDHGSIDCLIKGSIEPVFSIKEVNSFEEGQYLISMNGNISCPKLRKTVFEEYKQTGIKLSPDEMFDRQYSV